MPDENISQDRHRPQAEDLQTGRPANGIRGLDSPGSGSDLWLAVAASRYVHSTGDLGVLDERVGYIEGRAVNPGEDSDYDLPGRSTLVETHYDHCKRASIRCRSGECSGGLGKVAIRRPRTQPIERPR